MKTENSKINQSISKEIRILSEELKNQIAAGEVIEGAFSVVKELVENSIDSGADRIIVNLEGGGHSLIKVTDNGAGISSAQLELAVKEHATSKIQTAEDLYQIGTLGFRGEALSSIASVSFFTIRSKTVNEEVATSLSVKGGQILTKEKSPLTNGTEIIVENLFFNTPARRKFLKSAQAENRAIRETILKLALPFPEIHFELYQDGKKILDLPRRSELLARIADSFGNELETQLIRISGVSPYTSITGFISLPSYHKFNRMSQLVFTNKRCVVIKNLHYYISRAYEGFLDRGQHPAIFLFFDIDPKYIDVNVHPAKREIRFHKEREMGEAIIHSMVSALRSEDLEYLTHLKKVDTADSVLGSSEKSGDDSKIAPSFQNLYRKSYPRENDELNAENPDYALNSSVPENLNHTDFENTNAAKNGENGFSPFQNRIAEGVILKNQENATEPFAEVGKKNLRLLGVFAEIYLVLEESPLQNAPKTGQPSLVLLDFHAAHEKIQYERLVEQRNLSGLPEVQKLLIPVVMELTPLEMSLLAEHKKIFLQNGLEMEPFGPNSVVIHTLPYFINPGEVQENIRETLALIGEFDSRENLQKMERKLLGSKSCKSAIKKGHRISNLEADSLLKDLFLCAEPTRCPHGRPVLIGFDMSYLDKLFKRIL